MRCLASLVLLVGCSSEYRGDMPSAAETGTSGEPPAAESSSDDADLPEERLDVPPAAESSSGTVEEECTSFTDSGGVMRRPADIIWVVDNSPSMIEESDAVQASWRSSEDWIYALAVSPDGSRLAAGDWAGQVRLHELSAQ